MELSEEETKNYTLLEIEKILRSTGRSLRDFPSLPFPCIVDALLAENKLIQDELRYDRKVLVEDHKVFVQKLTNEQRNIYEIVMHYVKDDMGDVFFVYGYGAGKSVCLENSFCNDPKIGLGVLLLNVNLKAFKFGSKYFNI